MIFSSLIKCQWAISSQIQCVINVLMCLYLKEKSGTENIKCLIDFFGGWESRLGREPHMLLSSMLSSLLLSKTLQITPPCHSGILTYPVWTSEGSVVLTLLTVMGRRLLSIPVWLPSGHPFFPGQNSSFALAARLLFASSSRILPCCQIPFNLPDYYVGSFSWGWLQRYVHFWLFFCRRFLSQCNLFGGRMESLIIGYRYISQDNPQHPQLFLFCGAF